MSFTVQPVSGMCKKEGYRDLCAQAQALLHAEPDMIANAANLSALIFTTLPEVNWAGFYFLRDGVLVVGPFQGLPACVRIPLGRGVCGTAAATGQTQVVADVDAFEGHIACDAASRSEIVVPLRRDGAVIGVLDIDSPVTGRFDEEDRAGIEALARIYEEALQ